MDMRDVMERAKMAAADLVRMLRYGRSAHSREETRYYLRGVNLRAAAGTPLGGAGGLRAVVTDGHRALYLALPLPDGAEGMPDAIVPTKACDAVLALADALPGDVDVAIAASGQAWRFAAGDWALTSKLIDGSFPDSDRIVPTKNPHIATVNAGQLRDAVRRVGLVSSDKTRVVACHFTANGISVRAQSLEGGESVEEISGDYAGEELTIGFNAAYLSTLAEAVGGTDELALEMANAAAPVLIRVPDAVQDFAVLMPMRV